MRKDTLYVSDLDGTLLDNSSRLSETTLSMLSQAIASGAMVTVATARTPATVDGLLRRLPVPGFTDPATGAVMPLPAIVMTGAALWNLRERRFDSVSLVPEADVGGIIDAFDSMGLRPFIYCLSGNSFLNVYHTARMSRREEAFYLERRHLELKRFHLDQRPAAHNKVVLFFVNGPERDIARCSDMLRQATECSVSWYTDVINPGTGLMDIYAPGVSKAHAVRQLAAKVGASRVVVFGDNLNDLPMMRVADVAVAVDNALDPVKAEASVVVGANSTDAVARFILDD
ncbi:MAG: HAD hydrolase family protein [Muribaculaceae bacterium]|nr:HAD hydrolase family protein [Muribaculaceae bacterium]